MTKVGKPWLRRNKVVMIAKLKLMQLHGFQLSAIKMKQDSLPKHNPHRVLNDAYVSFNVESGIRDNYKSSILKKKKS